MFNVVGVKFRSSNKIYYFDSGKFNLKKGDLVIVETQGSINYRSKLDKYEIKGNKRFEDESIEFATVQVESMVIRKNIFKGYDNDSIKLRKVLRVANKKDLEKNETNRNKEKQAFKIFLEKKKRHKLDMKLIDVQITFDYSKILFYFIADGRIDFRDLVKDLAYIFKTRIELRQVGVRDEAKILNGIGICGRTLCCSTFLREFQPVSIKMAKDQNISLNPSKISGACGRLMCCLKYEQDIYEKFTEEMPNVGDIVKTKLGIGEVVSSNILKQVIKATIRKNENDIPSIHFFNISEFEIIERKKLEDVVIDREEFKEIMD